MAMIEVDEAVYGYWSAVILQAVVAGFFDEAGGGVDLAPVGLLAGLEVRNVAGQVAAAGDLDHFLDRFDQLVAFVADVAGVEAAVLADDCGDRDQLVGLGVCAGHVLQAGRHAPGALLHAGVGEVLHLLEFVGRGRAADLAHHFVADRARAARAGRC